MASAYVPGVPELIARVGRKFGKVRCGLCGETTCYEIGGHPAGFVVCARCDTTPEERKAWKLSEHAGA